MVVFENVKPEQLLKVVLPTFQKETVKTIYEELRLRKNNLYLILYHSGKLLLQGNLQEVELFSEKLRKAGIGQLVQQEYFRQETGWIIGSDETLKGDTFGGIVVAAVKADDSLRIKLKELSVADSKTLSDKEILIIAEKIRKIVPCEIRSILPEEYNRSHLNITELLNKLHQESARDLLPGKHVVDKYPGCAVGDVQVVRAESKYLEVAAASILARAAALQQLDYLSVQAGFRIPKGSTHVELALHELAEKKLDFSKFVKMDFNNVVQFLTQL